MAVILITGQAGSGKTSLCNAIAASGPAMDLDVLGVNYKDGWYIVPELVRLAYVQGARIFCGCGGNWMEAARLLASLDDDIRVMCITSKFRRQALMARNEYSKATRGYTRWTYKVADDLKIQQECLNLATKLKATLYMLDTKRWGVREDQRHGGSADDANCRSWRLAFPMPDCFKIGWRREGSSDVDEYVGKFLAFVKSHMPEMLTIAESNPLRQHGASKWSLVPGFDELVKELKGPITSALEARKASAGR